MEDNTTTTGSEPLRIASFLPSATEMLYALGLGDNVVGVSHECDYPPEAKEKQVLVTCALDLTDMTMAEIDKAVSTQLAQGKSIYHVDEAKLQAANPNMIVTQDLCEVCAPSGNEVVQVLKTLKPAPHIVWQTPKSFQQVLDSAIELGEKTGRVEAGQALVKEAQDRVSRIATKTEGLDKLKVGFFEWVDPVYCGGHWIPQMLAWAGGVDLNCKDGSDSIRIEWSKVLEWGPEVIIIAPCGMDLAKAKEQAHQIMEREGFANLPAAKTGRVFAVDANSYFARPGPRLVDGVELLAHLIHPELFPWTGDEAAYARVEMPAIPTLAEGKEEVQTN